MIEARILKDKVLFTLIVNFCGNLGAQFSINLLDKYPWIDSGDDINAGLLNSIVDIPHISAFSVLQCRLMLIPFHDIVNISYIVGCALNELIEGPDLDFSYVIDNINIDTSAIEKVNVSGFLENFIPLYINREKYIISAFSRMKKLNYSREDQVLVVGLSVFFQSIKGVQYNDIEPVYKRFRKQFLYNFEMQYIAYAKDIFPNREEAIFLIRRVISEFYIRYRVLFI